MRPKKGDIILNRWAGTKEGAYFIYTGTSGRYLNGMQLGNGRLTKTQYYVSGIDETLPDGNPAFEIVGHTNAYDVMKNDLVQQQERWRKE